MIVLLLFFIMAGAWCAEEGVPSEQTWVHHWSDCGEIKNVCEYSLPQGKKSCVNLAYGNKKDVVMLEDLMTNVRYDFHHKMVALRDEGVFLTVFVGCKQCEETASGSVHVARSLGDTGRLMFNTPDVGKSVPARTFSACVAFSDSDDFCEYRVRRRSMAMMMKLCRYLDETKFFLQADVRYDDLRKVVVSCGILDRDNNIHSVEPVVYDFSGFCSCALNGGEGAQASGPIAA